MYITTIVFIIFEECVLYNHVHYLSLFPCTIIHLHIVYETITFQMLIYRFKFMNMFSERHKQSHRWKTHLCLDIHNKAEQLIEVSRSL